MPLKLPELAPLFLLRIAPGDIFVVNRIAEGIVALQVGPLGEAQSEKLFPFGMPYSVELQQPATG